MRAKILVKAMSGLLGVVLLLAACSGGGSKSSGQSGSAAQQSGPVKLTFWSWATNVDKVVAIWNQKNPNIQVTVSTPAQGDALVTKLLAANKGGNPPDLFQAEYQALPSLITNGVAADISRYVGSIQGAFTDGAWKLVRFGSATYAIPQDFGPMMLFYRADLFKQYGLAVPTTWDQFAQEAAALHAKAPKRFLTTFSSHDPGWFAGLAEQAGAQWWSNDGKSWTVAINDAATQKVASYWNDLVTRGVIQGQPMYTPQWNKAMNDGTLLAWPSAVWGPAVLAGIAPDTKGNWAMAPLPAWTAGDQHVGFWGGSSTAVAAKSKHQAQAAQFAAWLNSDPQALEALVTQGSLYPAATQGQSTPSLQKAPDFMPNQPTFFQTAQQISASAAGFTWGPDVNVAYSAYDDAFSKAIQSRQPFTTALEAMQSATVADMKKAGFALTNS